MFAFNAGSLIAVLFGAAVCGIAVFTDLEDYRSQADEPMSVRDAKIVRAIFVVGGITLILCGIVPFALASIAR